MIIMKWKTDNEGRLVAAWEETRQFRKTIPCSCFAEATPKATPRLPAKGVRFFINPRSPAWKGAWVFIGALLLFCRPTAAQTTGTLRGTVEDGTGAVVPGARVSARSTSGSVNANN
jgi:hypothetical protein